MEFPVTRIIHVGADSYDGMIITDNMIEEHLGFLFLSRLIFVEVETQCTNSTFLTLLPETDIVIEFQFVVVDR